MKGKKVERKFGWDTHGLPVEFEMEKTLELNGGIDIENYGVAKFNEACRGIVLRYTSEWKNVVERMGRWIDMDNDYKTMDPEFMESVWWIFSQLWKQGLVYQGKKVVPYSWRLTAPLSNFEASQNYKDVQDPAVTVLAPLSSQLKSDKWAKWKDNTAIAIWTTTPWTLPSNLAIAFDAKNQLSYSRYKLIKTYGPKKEITHVILGDFAAEGFAKLIDLESKESVSHEALFELSKKHDPSTHHSYQPLFKIFDSEERKQSGSFTLIPADFVEEGQGTGFVHCAPAFGEDDYYACQEAKIITPDVQAADPTDIEAKFSFNEEMLTRDQSLTEANGLFVKEADKKIVKILKERGLLLKHETLQHSYPFCERSDEPLIYKAISSWFVKVEDFKDEIIENNQEIEWVPKHIKNGRFGKWLENARDWCISRNRFWGTPIPVWTCEKCGHVHVVGSLENGGGRKELSKLCSQEVSDLHKHFVDELTWDCEKCSAQDSMKRTPEVLDCWFESGSMPYAQEHYPFENKEKLDREFPADFIAEGLDQTRGWFYTLNILSTALKKKPAFKNCIVNGIVLAEDGRKMSKRWKNYPDPKYVFDKYGADALRLYFMQSPAMHGESLRFSEKQLVELMRSVMIPLWNAYGFFASYANIDHWTAENWNDNAPYTLLDKWIWSRVHETEKQIHEKMECFQLAEVAPILIRFIDDLTNWYIRLNRDRFWGEKKASEDTDKQAAYQCLWGTLKIFSKLIAPGLPFYSELLHMALDGKNVNNLNNVEAEKSIHLEEYGAIHEFTQEDKNRLERVSLAQKIILLGRSLRGKAKIGLRQPLKELRIAGVEEDQWNELGELVDLVKEEVNVKSLSLVPRGEELVVESAKPNFKTLGRKLGKDIKELQSVLRAWKHDDIANFESSGCFEFKSHKLELVDIQIVRQAKEGKLALADFNLVAELNPELDESLIREGVIRELINRIQQRRKEMQLHLSDRIEIKFNAESGSLVEDILKSESNSPDLVGKETLCQSFIASNDLGGVEKEKIGEHGELEFSISVRS